MLIVAKKMFCFRMYLYMCFDIGVIQREAQHRCGNQLFSVYLFSTANMDYYNSIISVMLELSHHGLLQWENDHVSCSKT